MGAVIERRRFDGIFDLTPLHTVTNFRYSGKRMDFVILTVSCPWQVAEALECLGLRQRAANRP